MFLLKNVFLGVYTILCLLLFSPFITVKGVKMQFPLSWITLRPTSHFSKNSFMT